MAWDGSGTVVEVRKNGQYNIQMDGSRKILLRNRRMLRPINSLLPPEASGFPPDLPGDGQPPRDPARIKSETQQATMPPQEGRTISLGINTQQQAPRDVEQADKGLMSQRGDQVAGQSTTEQGPDLAISAPDPGQQPVQGQHRQSPQRARGTREQRNLANSKGWVEGPTPEETTTAPSQNTRSRAPLGGGGPPARRSGYTPSSSQWQLDGWTGNADGINRHQA